MPPVNQELLKAFVEKSEGVTAPVVEMPSMAAAMQYVVDLCEKKEPAQLLADEPGTPTGPAGAYGLPTRVQRIVAAPDLSDEDFAVLSAACEAKGFACLRGGIRRHLAGIDVGVTHALLGVAASGTILMNTRDEQVRMASMVCEIHVVLLRKSMIFPDLPSVAPVIREIIASAPSSSATFITGPSRTSDIERVNALGVHGPLELHVILLED